MTKVALITGGARGIGKGIALQLAKDGFDIAITDLPNSKDVGAVVVNEIKSLGVNSVFIPADSSNQQDLINAVEQAHSQLGGFDVMVNNAGICILSPILEATPEMFQNLYNINVAGTIYGIQAAAKKFIELGQKGKIINACSIAGQLGFPMFGLYCGTKFAVKGITQAASKELGPKGITVNAYCPGITFTDMWDSIEDTTQELTGAAPGQTTKSFTDQISLGRGAEVQDIANLVSFLASEKSDYITGQSLVSDGGLVYP